MGKVNGDTLYEPDESFPVNLFIPENATIASGVGHVTIVNDDRLPSFAIDNPAVVEGSSGLTSVVFTVSLSSALDQPATVNVSTSDGTATAGSDYLPFSGILTFFPGQTAQQVTVQVFGDTIIEPDETFSLDLSDVTVKATANTGLVADDVFFYGNEIGATGSSNTTTISRVTSSDINDAQTHGASIKNNILIGNLYDFNKDGLINSGDVTIAQTHGTSAKTGLALINIAVGGPFAPEPASSAAVSSAVSTDAAVASALASMPAISTTVGISAWITNRLAQFDLMHVNLNASPIDTYFELLAKENVTASRATLAKVDQVIEALNPDDTLLESRLGNLDRRD